jgi:5-formyltetrahydrofolate cyclo-ligase
MIHKSIIREQGKAARAALSPEVRLEYDARIIERCQTELGWADYERVMLFLPIERQQEINLWPLVKWIWAEHPAVEVYVPRVIGGKMEAVQLSPLSKIAMNNFGIPEPADGEVLAAGEPLDLILTPLLGFDDSGNRVGYGKGYYDKFFQVQPTAERIGLGYACLFVPKRIETARHDVALNGVITEN